MFISMDIHALTEMKALKSQDINKTASTNYIIIFFSFASKMGSFFCIVIMKTCPCNEYLLTPHFYIGKVGFTGVFIFFLFLL